MTTAVAIYTRISDDRAGDSAGVRRQREACEKLAADRGLWLLVILILWTTPPRHERQGRAWLAWMRGSPL